MFRSSFSDVCRRTSSSSQPYSYQQVYHGKFTFCKYRPILRPKYDDVYIEYGKYSDQFDKDVVIKPEHEFLEVICLDRNNHTFYANVHGFITIKPHVEKRCNQSSEFFSKNHTTKEKFNVLLIGVDSVSRLNFLRNMIQTRDFLVNHLDAIEMSGYNKVGENTFPNMVPLLTGKFVSELGWNNSMIHQPFDIYDYVWNNFSAAGYRTLFAEDNPSLALFRRKGFNNPPTDYYFKPLALSMEKQSSLWNQGHCFTDRHETDIFLNYTSDFAETFKDKPHFGFTFITRLTHNDLDHARYADFIYVEFLRKIKSQGLLNNTILFFFSDHGLRFGDWRMTYIGKIEDRLPFSYLVLPEKFHQKYPKIVETIRKNSKRLTTTFDIHETLNDILNFNSEVKPVASESTRGISLFQEIPQNRTCEHAGINPHCCLCMEQTYVDKDSLLSLRIAEGVVSHINNILSSSQLCANLSLESISEIVKIQLNDKVLSVDKQMYGSLIFNKNKVISNEMYQMSLTTLPAHAAFEATVNYNHNTKSVHVNGQVSRINAYGNQSICVDNSMLRLYCYCKTNKD